jgi:hypothetical protein
MVCCASAAFVRVTEAEAWQNCVLVLPPGGPLPDLQSMAGTNVAVHLTTDAVQLAINHQFTVVVAPNVLAAREVAGPGGDLAGLLRHLVRDRLAPGGIALFGALSAAGPAHALLAAAAAPGGRFFDAARLRDLLAAEEDLRFEAEGRALELRAGGAKALADALRRLVALARPPGDSGGCRRCRAARAGGGRRCRGRAPPAPHNLLPRIQAQRR